MTPSDHKALGKYIRWCANELGLRDWTLSLLYDRPDDPETGAQIKPMEGKKLADMGVCCEFRELPPDRQRQYIIHELLHLHAQGMWEIIRNDLWEGRLLGQEAYRAIECGFRRQMEFAVDGIAEAIAKHYPLIEWPKPKGKP